jgi:hypothetical protein
MKSSTQNNGGANNQIIVTNRPVSGCKFSKKIIK